VLELVKELQEFLSFLNKREERKKEKREEVEKKRHNYKNLKIWKLGLEISNDISDLLQSYPSHEKYDLSSQMNRCSISIPSNIAEGSARTDKSFSYFLDVSLGSSFELETQLLVSKHKKYIDSQQLELLDNKLAEFQRMTMSFQNGLNK
jgi:four helix bundle protein